MLVLLRHIFVEDFVKRLIRDLGEERLEVFVDRQRFGRGGDVGDEEDEEEQITEELAAGRHPFRFPRSKFSQTIRCGRRGRNTSERLRLFCDDK
jgi:hypothetical protein